MAEQATCKYLHCKRPLEQVRGHRRREYCDENCKQSAYRERREQQHKDDVARRWQAFTPGTRNFLDWHMSRYGEDAATAIELVILHECALARESGNDRIAQLEQQHDQQTGALREKQLRRVDRLKARIAELEPANVTHQADNDCAPYRAGLEQVQERFRAYVAMTNARLETLTGELAARRQEQERGPGECQEKLTRAGQRIVKLEQQVEIQRQRLGDYYQRVHNGLRNREKLQLELVAIGERLHWRMLINGHTTISPGEESWRLYIEQSEDTFLTTAIQAARFYHDNLKSLGMLP